MSAGNKRRFSGFWNTARLRLIVPVVDLATDKCVGYLSDEYLNKKARIGLTFYAAGMAWRIFHTTQGESILVLPSRKVLGVVFDSVPVSKSPRSSLAVETGRISLEKPSDRILVLESFKNYLILHAPLGAAVNRALSMIFDAILTEEDLVRAVYSNGYGILIQTPANLTSEEIQLVSEETLTLTSSEIDSYLEQSLESRFPDLTDEHERPLEDSRTVEMQRRLKRRLKSIIDTKHMRQFYEALAAGKMGVERRPAHLGQTPLARSIIDEFRECESTEMNRLLKTNGRRLKANIRNVSPRLVCLSCTTIQPSRKIDAIKETPLCIKCGSRLLSITNIPDSNIYSIFRKKRSGQHLNAVETRELVQARLCADIVLSYGRSGVIALSVLGVGPQTASRILAMMHQEESSFYRDLLQAKLHFVATREYWDN